MNYDAGDLSNLAKAVKERPRPTTTMNVGPYVGLGETIHEVAYRVPTKREQDLAYVGALEYVAKLAAKNHAAKDNPNLLNDAMGAFIIAEGCRRAADPEKMPTWPGGEFVIDNLTPDQIAANVRILNQVRDRESPTPTRIEMQTVDDYAERYTKLEGTDYADIELAAHEHSFLVHLYLLTLSRLGQARAERDALQRALGELQDKAAERELPVDEVIAIGGADGESSQRDDAGGSTGAPSSSD